MWLILATVATLVCVVAVFLATSQAAESPEHKGCPEVSNTGTEGREEGDKAIRKRVRVYSHLKGRALEEFGEEVASAMGLLSDEDIALCEADALDRKPLNYGTDRFGLLMILERAWKDALVPEGLRVHLWHPGRDETPEERNLWRHKEALAEVEGLHRLWESVGCVDVFEAVKARVFGETKYPLPMDNLKQSLELAKTLCGVDRDRFLADLRTVSKENVDLSALDVPE